LKSASQLGFFATEQQIHQIQNQQNYRRKENYWKLFIITPVNCNIKLNVLEIQPIPVLTKRIHSSIQNFIPIIGLGRIFDVLFQKWTRLGQLDQLNPTPILQAHPRVNPYLDHLSVNRLCTQIKVMVHLEVK